MILYLEPTKTFYPVHSHNYHKDIHRGIRSGKWRYEPRLMVGKYFFPDLNLPDTDRTQIQIQIRQNTMFYTGRFFHSWDNIDQILNFFHEHSYSNCLDLQKIDFRHKSRWDLDNHRNHLDS